MPNESQFKGGVVTLPSFRQKHADLISRICRQAASQQPPDWERAPEIVFTEKKEEVDVLFNRFEEERLALTRDSGSCDPGYGRRLRRTLFPKDTGYTRHWILATMLLLDIESTHLTWKKFVKMLNDGQLPSDLCDQKMPFREEDIRRFFGETWEGVSEFERMQYIFTRPFVSKFESELHHLRCFLEEKLVRCSIMDKGSVEARQSDFPNDMFLPTDLTRQLLEEKKDNIEALYLEFRKTGIQNMKPSEQYDYMRQAALDAPRFFDRVQQCPKILGTFILMDVKPNAQIWQSFVDRCLRFDDPALQDPDQPFEHTALRQSLPCNISECHIFCQTQYAFYAIELRDLERIDLRNQGPNLRLPLCRKHFVGSGAYGRVYSVRVKAHHYRSDDREFAMKWISLREGEGEPNEWTQLQYLFKQKMKHERIFNVRACVRTYNAMLMFFPLADCDLHTYMTKESPQSLSHKQRCELLDSMVGIAHALKYLHCLLENEDGRIACYHKDIKAENVLVRVENSTGKTDGELRLYLTDLGIASIIKQKGERELSLYNNTRHTLRAQTTGNQLGDNCGNIAPEARNNGRVSASTDIWGYGTLLADFIVWLLDGQKGLQNFQQARLLEPSDDMDDDCRDDTFFRIGKEGTILKHCIEQGYRARIERKRSMGAHRDAELYARVWTLLKEKMLKCDPKERQPIENIHTDLNAILRDFRHTVFESNDLGEDRNLDEDSTAESVADPISRSTYKQVAKLKSDDLITSGSSEIPSLQSLSSDSQDTRAVPTPDFSNADGGDRAQGRRRKTGASSHSQDRYTENVSNVPRKSSQTRAFSPEQTQAQKTRSISDQYGTSIEPVLSQASSQLSQQKASSSLSFPTPRDSGTFVDSDGASLPRSSIQHPDPTVPGMIAEAASSNMQQKQKRTSKLGIRFFTMPGSAKGQSECSIKEQLRSAVESENIDKLIQIMDKMDMNSSDNQEILLVTLDEAFKRRGDTIASKLVDKLGSIQRFTDPTGRVLHKAAERGMLQTISKLMQHGANSEGRDDNGYTPLLSGIQARQEEAVEVLIRAYGVETDVKDQDGLTVLHHAIIAELSRGLIVWIMEKHSTLVNFQDKHGYTPLHRCALHFSEFSDSSYAPRVAEELLKRQADPNMEDNKRRTARRIVADTKHHPERNNLLRTLDKYAKQH